MRSKLKTLDPVTRNTIINTWYGKRYYALSTYFKEQYTSPIYKLALDGGFTCPNRDGTLATTGCIFCSNHGSGDFTPSSTLSLKEQLKEGKKLLQQKHTNGKYIAYFQAYTNTYGTVDRLQNLYYSVLEDPDIVGISIGTRPDCIDDKILSLLTKLNTCTDLYIELGLQTIHPTSIDFIRRHYANEVYENTVKKLIANHIKVIPHLIIGLPKEEKSDIIDTVRYVSKLPIHGIKFHMLYIMKNTDLAKVVHKETLTLEAYADIITDCIAELPKDIVIHRITGDPPKDDILYPLWTTNKQQVLNTINKTLADKNLWQGALYYDRSR